MLFLCYCYLGAAKRAVTNIVHKAKSDYFSSQIAQSNCCKELFDVCNELRGCNSGLFLPIALPVCDLPDAFADYFIRKVKTIRDELDSQMPVPVLPTPNLPCTFFFFFFFFFLNLCQCNASETRFCNPEDIFTRPASHVPLCWMLGAAASCSDSRHQSVSADWYLYLCL